MNIPRRGSCTALPRGYSLHCHKGYSENGAPWSCWSWRLQHFISSLSKSTSTSPSSGQWACFLNGEDCGRKAWCPGFLDLWGEGSFWIPGWLPKAAPEVRLGRIQNGILCSRNPFPEHLVSSTWHTIIFHNPAQISPLWHFHLFPRQNEKAGVGPLPLSLSLALLIPSNRNDYLYWLMDIMNFKFAYSPPRFLWNNWQSFMPKEAAFGNGHILMLKIFRILIPHLLDKCPWWNLGFDYSIAPQFCCSSIVPEFLWGQHLTFGLNGTVVRIMSCQHTMNWLCPSDSILFCETPKSSIMGTVATIDWVRVFFLRFSTGLEAGPRMSV